MNKKLLSMFFVLLMTALLAIGTFAAEVYVMSGATGTGESADNAVGTLADAITALDGNGGTIYLCDAVTVSEALTIPEQSADLTITSAEGMAGSLVLDGTVTLGKNENANTFVFDMPLTASSTITIYGGFNSVHFTEKFEVTGKKINFYGGVLAPSASSDKTHEVALVPEENLSCVTELPYSITVDNGWFNVFSGGNSRASVKSVVGSIAGDLDITINGGTFDKAVPYTTTEAIKRYYAFSISGGSLLAANATLTITDGTFKTPVYLHSYLGQTGSYASAGSPLTYSDAKYYAADGDVLFDIQGGTFTADCIEISAEQTAASYNRLHRGNFTLKIGADATLADGIVLDATQVKAYSGSSQKATLNYANAAAVTAKCFDTVENTGSGTVTENKNEPIRIACIGDSITEGVGSSSYATDAYPSQLYQQAVEAGEYVIVSNYGSSGAKVLDYEGKPYNEGLAYTLSMHETDADYVIIGLGTNDARMTTHTYGMSDRFYEEYKALLEGYGELPETDIVFNTSAIYRRDYRCVATVSNIHPLQKKAQQELAAEAKTADKDVQYTFIDLYALTLEDMITVEDGSYTYFNDSVHPNATGYEKVYAPTILNAIFGENPVREKDGFKTMTDVWVSAEGTNNTDCTLANPTSNLSIALSRAADGATVHILGDFNFNRVEKLSSYSLYDGYENLYGAFSTPIDTELTIVGADENGDAADVTLTINTDQVYIKNDITFKNITLVSSKGRNAYTPLHISLGYNNVTFDESFKTDTAKGTVLVAGYITYGEDKEHFFYNSRESVSSAKDCAITVNGGDWLYFLGGNYLFTEYTKDGVSNTQDSLYGTYSGNMIVNIGENVTIANALRSGAVGQNYLTGSITMNVGAWEDGGAIRTYSWLGDVPETAEYDASLNTGTVTVNLSETVNATVARPYDFDDNGKFDVADILQILKLYIRNSENTAAYFPNHCDFADMKLLDALHLLQTFVQQ